MSKLKLSFTPYAKAKIHHIRDIGSTEICGFGISTIENPTLVIDFVMVPQKCTSATAEMEDDGLLVYQDAMLAKNYDPWQFRSIWIHTHPGSSANPSGTDETTYTKFFKDKDFGIMYILAKGGSEYARIHTQNQFTKQDIIVDCEIDFSSSKAWDASTLKTWDKEYKENVIVPKPIIKTNNYGYGLAYGNQYGNYYHDYTGQNKTKKNNTNVNAYVSKNEKVIDSSPVLYTNFGNEILRNIAYEVQYIIFRNIKYSVKELRPMTIKQLNKSKAKIKTESVSDYIKTIKGFKHSNVEFIELMANAEHSVRDGCARFYTAITPKMLREFSEFLEIEDANIFIKSINKNNYAWEYDIRIEDDVIKMIQDKTIKPNQYEVMVTRLEQSSKSTITSPIKSPIFMKKQKQLIKLPI